MTKTFFKDNNTCFSVQQKMYHEMLPAFFSLHSAVYEIALCSLVNLIF